MKLEVRMNKRKYFFSSSCNLPKLSFEFANSNDEFLRAVSDKTSVRRASILWTQVSDSLPKA